MKSLLVAVASSLLGLVLASLAAAQQLPQANQPSQAKPANPYQDATLGAPFNPSVGHPQPQATPLSTAEAKKRYLATQQRLQNLVKGGNLPSARWLSEGSSDLRLEVVDPDERPRDRLRKAVAEDFDARRQLQQAELAELENRILRINRALEIRDAMRDTIIDQRTDELFDQLEESGKPGQSAEPGAGRPATSGVKQAAPPDNRTDPVKEQAQLLKRQLDEAKANFESAERAYERARRLFEQGAISEEVLAEEEQKLKTAKLAQGRLLLQMDAFLEAHRSVLGDTKEPPARASAVNEPNKTPDQAAIAETAIDDGGQVGDHAMLAALESGVAEAKANRDSAEREYKRFEQMSASGAIEQAIADEKAEQCKRAQIRLEREELKRDAFFETHRPGATPADRKAVGIQANRRLAALNVQEAEASLAEQEIRYERFKRLVAVNAVQPRLLDEQADKYKHAQIELERAKAKLKAFTGGERPVDEQTKTSSVQPAADGGPDRAPPQKY